MYFLFSSSLIHCYTFVDGAVFDGILYPQDKADVISTLSASQVEIFDEYVNEMTSMGKKIMI